MNLTQRGYDVRHRPRDTEQISDAFLADRPAAPIDEPVAAGPFPTVRRGYDPDVVDERVTRLLHSVQALRAALDESERRREQAEQHALAVENEIRAVRSGHLGVAEPEAGFGARAERMLRLAEQEASDLRAKSARSAADLLDRTRQEAERHRHESEQKIITETARAEQHIARRLADTQQREDAVRDQVASARAEVERIRADATRSADARRAEVAADVREQRDRAEREVDRARSEAEAELSHLRSLHRRTRGDLHRIADVVRAAIDGTPVAGADHAGAGADHAGAGADHAGAGAG